ncbi:MAG TPA: AsmA-like C-terminal region-containing protein [Verrucomicrobiae bacterium]|nr:AsmA-like C-terminal region-containing protein [Verrucomicrobiae bacterium]
MNTLTLHRSRSGRCLTILVVLLVLLAIAVAGAWFGINTWLKSGNLDASIKSTLTDAVGAPVDFEGLGFVPFTRVALRKLSVANPDAKGAAPLVTCRNIELGLSPTDLIHGRLRFERLGIDTPDVRLMQDAAGNYRLPSGGGGKGAKTEKSPKKEGEARASAGPAQEWTIDMFQIRDGRIEGIGKDGRRLWLAEGLKVKAKVGQSGAGVSAKGDAEVGRAMPVKDFALTGLSTPFAFEADKLSLPKLSFTCYGGSGSGMVTFDATGGRAYQATVDAGGVDASSAVAAFGADPSTISGKISLHVEVSGEASRPEALHAMGNFAIQPAKLVGNSIMKTLGAILMVPELSNSEFAAVRGQFEVRGEQIIFSDLRTEPRERLQVVATGSVGFDGQLDLKGTLAAKSETLNLAPLLARAGGAQSADGFTEVPFVVKGTTDNPKVSVAPSAAGSMVGGFLQKLIGGGQKQKTKGDSGTPQTTEPQQEQKPADALKRLLPFRR